MTVGASLYEPINVFKPMGPDIGIVDGPFEYLTVGGVTLPLLFTTRMTVVRLSNGNLCLQSPIKFVEVLASELQRMGTIRHLVSPNQFHYAHMVVESLSRCDPMGFTACTPKSARSAHRCHVCKKLLFSGTNTGSTSEITPGRNRRSFSCTDSRTTYTCTTVCLLTSRRRAGSCYSIFSGGAVRISRPLPLHHR